MSLNFFRSIAVAGLVAMPAASNSATLVSFGDTGLGTFEAVYTEDIIAGSSGTATINTYPDRGIMGWLLDSSGGVILTDALRSGFLDPGESSDRGYTHSGATDGLLTLTVAWALNAWAGVSDDDAASILDPDGLSPLFADLCVLSCDTSGGSDSGDGSGNGSPSEVPLPASAPLLLAAVFGLAKLRRKRTA